MGDNIRISALTRCQTLSGSEYLPLTQDYPEGTLTTYYATPEDFAAYAVNVVLPAGIINPYAGAAAPSGWLLCDGSAISKTVYARLYAAIGDVYGTSSTTFNVPNLQGRIPLGVCGITNLNQINGTEGSGPNQSITIGMSGGEFRHSLSASELPNHSHRQAGYLLAIGTRNDPIASVASNNRTTDLANGILKTAGQIYGNTGAAVTANQPHNNLPPYVAVNYIIKI